MVTALVSLIALAAVDGETAFRERVAPIFERHCLRCHQGDAPKGGLSLADGRRALAGGESGPAILPGKPDESPLLDLISGQKPEMPKEADPLSADEIAAIRQWIAEGAIWPDGLVLEDRRGSATWWSLQPLARPAVPPPPAGWGHNEIDAFVFGRLAESGLSPSPEADRRTLIRRLSYDLHGLPPAPDDVEAFVNDAAPQAYERLVDRLLASPRYGERWGRHWLDTVHFGETHGYDKDKVRPNAWPYRDYVIRAFNDDTPYGRFVAEQVAGDVLFPDDPQGVVATGFIAAGPWDFVGHVELREGTVDKDIARSNDRDDMVATAMSTFLSLTVHCARCHNHKFDPITQRDYYRLQAVFAGVDRADRPYDLDPRTTALRRDLAAERQALELRQQAVADAMAKVTSPEIEALDRRMTEWNGRLAALPVEPSEASKTLGYHSAIMPSPDETKWVQVDLGTSLAIDRVTLVPAHVAYGGHPGPGFGFPQRFKVELSDTADFSQSQVLDDQTAADFPHPGDAPYRIDSGGRSGRYVRVTATRLWKRTGDWVFALAELLVQSGGRNAAAEAEVTSLDSIEAPPGWARTNLVDGYSSLERLSAPPGSAAAQRRELNEQIEEAAAQRRELVAAALDESVRAEQAAVAAGLADVQRRLDLLPPPATVFAAASEFVPQGSFAPAGKPRPVALLQRGNVRSPGDLMPPGGVACVPGLSADFQVAAPDDEGQRRAALARWLTDPGNALLRRSIVNRVWHYHFGQGLVDTPNDFGRMGSKPSHPELLEWLAGWFADHGESLKALHHLIVCSAAYRQSSASNAESEQFDAGNRLLWRMNRRRLDAECVRDAVLAASGKLDLTMGGPSVHQFFFKDDHSPVYDYTRFEVDDPRSFRRSVYRFIVRSVPDPFMESLDCADPSILTPKRNTTLTALQALALLNNPFMVRQCEHFAERVRGLAADPGGQVRAAYLLALSRPPRPEEAELLVRYLEQRGLANACRVILNSNEFMFVD